jgi:pyruvate,orthophosphate dikinase
MAKAGEKVILVRNETSPEDVHGMHASQAILTAKGGMTSHAALVARGWGKCCIVGCGELIIDYHNRQMSVKERVLKEGDIITLNGTKGYMYEGALPLVKIDLTKNKELRIFLKTCDELARLQVWTNADTPQDAAQARTFGAKGIGLTRTEHMFFAPERIRAMREMIVAETEETRRSAIMKLLPFQKNDFIGILKAMKGLPVTIRLLDPPLHEFLPQEPNLVRELAGELGITVEKLEGRIKQLHELNPMLGLRGCRLGIIFPEITEMQTRAILEATAELTRQRVKVYPEIMIPLVGHLNELKNQKALIMKVAEDVKKAYNLKALHFRVGTMIEVPRAAITADEIAKEAEFFSFGTNDLTQMGCGFSRDDAGSFLPGYVNMGIYRKDPFQSLDQEGVGKMVAIGVERGRKMRPNLKIGICGEHGGDPDSIDFCHRVGLDYVSCSPYRVPIARLAAAQAAVRNGICSKHCPKTFKAKPKKK